MHLKIINYMKNLIDIGVCMKKLDFLIVFILFAVFCSSNQKLVNNASAYRNSDEFKKEPKYTISGKRNYEELIKDVIDSQYMARMRTEYNNLLKSNPGLNGWVFMQLAIISDGTVIESKVSKSTINNSNFIGKIIEYSKTWKFNIISEQDTSIVIFPFVFSQ